jgi:protein-tyrosine phosphatase
VISEKRENNREWAWAVSALFFSLFSISSFLHLQIMTHRTGRGGLSSKSAHDPPTEILPHLWLGSARNAKDEELMKQNGITHILNCANECNTEPSEGSSLLFSSLLSLLLMLFSFTGSSIKYLKVGMIDEDDEDVVFAGKHSYRKLEDLLVFIEDARLNNGKCFVHCMHGRSRSAFVVVG